MARLKILVGLVGLLSLIFAEGVNLDSAKINVLKRQRLFYTTADNWIPPTLPDDPTCLWAGCCLIPITGCIGIGQKFFVKKDTTQQDTTEVKKKRKWGLGIGYSLSLCYTGQDFRKSYGDFMIDPFLLIAEQLYWLNSIEGNMRYSFTKICALELGFGYGWATTQRRYDVKYDFELFPVNINGVIGKSIKIKTGYIYSFAYKNAGKFSGKGGGHGFMLSFGYKFNRVLSLFFSYGKIMYVRKEGAYFPSRIYLSLNGINFSVGYEFR